MAAWLGCAEHAPGLPRRTGKALLAERWQRVEAAHGWPVLLGSRGAGPGAWFRAAVGADGDRNCVVPCDWDEAQVLAMSGRWTVVEADAADAEDLQRPAAKLAAAFLGRLLGRGLSLPGEKGLTGRVLDAMAAWVRDAGYDAAAVRMARAVTEPAPAAADRPKAVAAAFGGLAGLLADQGAVREGRWYTAQGGKKPGLSVVREGGTVWVPKADVYAVLAYRGMPPVNDAALTADLARAGIARVEDRYDPPVSGWAFDYGWWKGQLDRYRGRTKNTLRAAG